MAETTGIAWTDATFNPWIGCTKVGPGCDHCYAEAQDARWNSGNAPHWGAGAPRRRTSLALWNKPIYWNRIQALAKEAGAQPLLRSGNTAPLWIFCASLADVFDNEIDPAWRADLWWLIRSTPHLRWQLVTKRIGNVAKMLPYDWDAVCASVDGVRMSFPYAHVGIIATMVNQAEWDRDAEKLIALKHDDGVKWIGASVEPMIGPIEPAFDMLAEFDWIIVGGESAQRGAKARPFDLAWADEFRLACRDARVPFFLKQMGDNPIAEGMEVSEYMSRAGTDPSEWPIDLRVREMPRIYDKEAP